MHWPGPQGKHRPGSEDSPALNHKLDNVSRTILALVREQEISTIPNLTLKTMKTIQGDLQRVCRAVFDPTLRQDLADEGAAAAGTATDDEQFDAVALLEQAAMNSSPTGGITGSGRSKGDRDED